MNKFTIVCDVMDFSQYDFEQNGRHFKGASFTIVLDDLVGKFPTELSGEKAQYVGKGKSVTFKLVSGSKLRVYPQVLAIK